MPQILGLPDKYASAQVHPPHFDIESVIRPNILALQPYRCARDDYKQGVLLDANENALGHSIPRTPANASDPDLDSELHRYPDPSHDEIKSSLARLRGIPGPEYVFLGVGSDEVIDLLMRVCCQPQTEKILITPPTYGMYSVCANVNDVGIVKINLDVEGGKFQPKVDEIHQAISADPSIKLIFLCSPGNPTGTLIPLTTVEKICSDPAFKGIVVVDEAYIDFADGDSSAVKLVERYANIVIMQTLSKSFGLAAIRLGLAIAQPPLIQILTNTKAPYNVSSPTARLAISALSAQGISLMHSKVNTLLASRAALISEFSSPTITSLGVGPIIGGNHANFVLLPILSGPGGTEDNTRAGKVYKMMAELEKGNVVVRYRGGEVGCKGCLRVTVGTEEENNALLERLTECLKVTLPA